MADARSRAELSQMRARGETDAASQLEILMKSFDAATNSAVRATATGIPLTKQAQSFGVFTNDQMRQTILAVKRGEIDAVEGAARINKALARGADTFGKQVSFAGDIFEGAALAGFDAESRELALVELRQKKEYEGLSDAEIVEKEQERQANASGDLTKKYASASVAAADTSKNLQRLGMALAITGTPAVEKFSNALKQATDVINDKFGLKPQPKGGTEGATTGIKESLLKFFGLKGGGVTGSGLGAVARQFESGGAGAGTVSTGVGDYGGKSYGLYQLSSKMGQVQEFLKSNEQYGKQFEGLAAGTAEFDKKWKELGGDKGFAEAQQAFAKQKYYDQQVKTLGQLGKQLEGKGQAVQEALFSTGVQYGGSSKLIEKALAGKDVDKMGEKDIINAIQDYKAQNVSTNFRSSSAEVQQSVAKRIEQERAALMATGPRSGYQKSLDGVEPDKTLPKSGDTAQTASTRATENNNEYKAQTELLQEQNALLRQTVAIQSKILQQAKA